MNALESRQAALYNAANSKLKEEDYYTDAL
jgi:hypothetical protein